MYILNFWFSFDVQRSVKSIRLRKIFTYDKMHLLSV